MSLSIPITRAPSRPKCFTVSDPINPADPVTMIVRFMFDSSEGLFAVVLQSAAAQFASDYY
jgi:hypothetical protein